MHYRNGRIEGKEIACIARRAKAKLGRRKIGCVVVRGVSGLTVGSVLAVRLNADLVVVRKPGESNHDSGAYTGISPHEVSGDVLVVDDFVETGATIRAILEAIRMDPEQCLLMLYHGDHPALTARKIYRSYSYQKEVLSTVDREWLNRYLERAQYFERFKEILACEP